MAAVVLAATAFAAYAVEPADTVTSVPDVNTETADSLFYQLSEVVVEGRTQRVIKYGVEYIPDKRTKRAAADATQLLLHMQIPQLNVVAGSNDVTTSGGKSVRMFIDYHPASQQELDGMRPQDVVRVEVLQYPQDPRFEGAAYVVNFIMQQYEWGGYTKVTASGATVGNDSGSAGIFSRFSLKNWIFDAYASGSMTHNDRYGDYSRETYRDIDFRDTRYDEVDRISKSDSYLKLNNSQYASLRASLNTKNAYFYHYLTFYRDATPRNRKISTLSMPQLGIADVTSTSNVRSQSITPAIHGYYYFRLPKENTLSLSWDFSYSHTRRNSLYSVPSLDAILNTNRENAYAPSMNVSYSKKFRYDNTFRTALMTYNTFYDTRYGGSYDGRQKLLSSENMIFLEYMQNWKFGLSLYSRVGMSYVIGRVNGSTVLRQWNPRLGAQLEYQFNDKHSASIEGWWGNGHPGASEYNEALVQSNELLWLQGNPDLKNTLFQTVAGNYTFMPTNGMSFTAYLEYEGNPDKQAYEYLDRPGYDGLIRRTVNSGDYRSYLAILSSTVRLFDNALSFQAQGRIQRAEYTGIDSSRQTWLAGWAQAVYYLKDFYFIANYTSPKRILDGYSHGRTIKMRSTYGVVVGYGHGDWNVRVSYYNWFNRGRMYVTSDNPRFSSYSWEWNGQTAPRANLSVTYTFGYGKKVSSNNELQKEGSVNSAILK